MVIRPGKPRRLERLRTIWRLDAFPKTFPADFVAELRRRVRDGEYDSREVVQEIALHMLRSHEA